MFDLRKIEAFCKVCEQRSFSKAGEALFLSQPTVSAHIQSLERDFDVRLLDRMGRTVLPTPAGAVLYRYAKQAIDRLETARAEINALIMEVTGDLLLGSSSIPAHNVLPKVLAAFAEAYPKVKPSLTVASSAIIAAQVLAGDLMAGIVASGVASDPDLIAYPLLKSEIIVIVPASMSELPLAPDDGAPPDLGPDLPAISFATAASLHWILREQNSSTRGAFEEALRHAGYDIRLLKPRLVVDSSHAAVQYVRSGLGVSAVARISVETDLARGDIRAYRIARAHALREFSCIMNIRRLPFPTAAVFKEFLLARTSHLRTEMPPDPFCPDNGDGSGMPEPGLPPANTASP